MRRSFLGLAALAAGLLAVASLSQAQTYPTSNQYYTPSATLAPASATTAGTVATFQLNNVDTLIFRVSGDHATAVAHVEGTSEAGTSATWSTVAALPLQATQGGPSLTANGLYAVNTAGLKQVRVVLDSIVSGTFTVAMNGDGGTFPGDYNRDIGAVITFTNQAAGTVNSVPQFNYDAKGVSCRFTQTANTSTPSTVFSIQSYDAASATWATIATAPAVATNTSQTMMVYPGLPASTATPVNSVNAHLGGIWRAQAVVTGGSGSTATLGCGKLK